MKLQGSYVALVTPMNETGGVDYDTLARLIDWHVAMKTDGIVVVGSTGESATLSHEEQHEIIRFAIAHVKKRVPLIAGTGSNATHVAVALTQAAEKLGADACLVVTPYYNRPTQEGLYRHYAALAEAVRIPIIMYNVPGRTGCDLLPETVARLSKAYPSMIGIKDATAQLSRLQALLREARPGFEVYSGDDDTALDWLKEGAHGVISVTANVAPQLMHEMCEAALRGDFARAASCNEKLALLHKRLFLESNPIPVKWALSEMGKINPHIRLPLLTLDKKHQNAVKEAMHLAEIE